MPNRRPGQQGQFGQQQGALYGVDIPNPVSYVKEKAGELWDYLTPEDSGGGVKESLVGAGEALTPSTTFSEKTSTTGLSPGDSVPVTYPTGLEGEYPGQQGWGGTAYDQLIMQQIGDILGDSGAPDIAAQVQMDVLGPGYQGAEYGAAAAGVPGAGRVMRGREAVERKAAIQAAGMRRQNEVMQNQLVNAYLDQAFKRQKLSSDEAIALSELITQLMAWGHDEHPQLNHVLPSILQKAFKGGNYTEVLTILASEVAKSTGEGEPAQA